MTTRTLIEAEALDYFRVRVSAARTDAAHALEFVTREATSPELEARAIAALVEKANLLWQIADAIDEALHQQRGAR